MEKHKKKLAILNLSNDSSILNKNSSLAKRIGDYARLAEKYDIIAPDRNSKQIQLYENSIAYGVGAENKIIAFFKLYKQAKDILKKEKYDLITVQDQYYIGLIAYLLARKFKIGLEIQNHGWEKNRGLRRLIARFILPRASAVRAVSERLKNRLISEFGVTKDKITVVPIYLEIKNEELKISEHDERKNFIFLTVSRLVPVKNIKMQVEAMAEVQKKYPNVELWIIGDGRERKKLEDKSKKLKVNVKFFGWQNNTKEYYKQADVFLLTSNYEGWGMAIVEAARAGLPIIMTDVGLSGDLIINGQSGLIIPIGGLKDLINAMENLIKNENLRFYLGRGARKAVISLPNKEEHLRLYLKSWQKAAGIL